MLKKNMVILLILFSISFVFNGRVFAQGAPASGTFKTIFIFAHFDDCPDFTFTKQSLVNDFKSFYSTMSNNSLAISDLVLSVELKESDKYDDIEEANLDVLQAVDNLVDFSKYTSYDDTNIIDGVFIIYSSWEYLSPQPSYSGISGIPLDNYNTLFDGVKISSGYADDGSGFIMNAKNGEDYSLWISLHEFGHNLLGSGHPGSYPYYNLMNGATWLSGGTGGGMDSYERSQLGWTTHETLFDISDTNPTSSYSNIFSFSSDFMTTGKVYQFYLPSNEATIHPPAIITFGNGYHKIENRRRISSFDQRAGKGSSGLFLYTGTSPYSLLLADGNDNSFDYNSGDGISTSAYSFNHEYSKLIHTVESPTYQFITQYNYRMTVTVEKESSDDFSISHNVPVLLSTSQIWSEGIPIGKISHELNKTNSFEYNLSQNYPNPFNPSTSISYSIKEASIVNISIYDIMGKLVGETKNLNLSEGIYNYNFNGENLPSGIYIFNIVAIGKLDTYRSSIKMQLLK